MRPHCAVFCHRSIVADCCPVQFADELWWRAFSASPASQSVRWLFRSIGPRPHTPSVFCHRWSGPMTLGPRRYSMPPYRTGRFGRFLLGCICFWGEIKSPRQGEKPQLGGKPIGRALAVPDASSLSRNRSGLFCAQPALPSTVDRKIAPHLCGAIASIR